MTYNVFGGTLSLTQSINHMLRKTLVNDSSQFIVLWSVLLTEGQNAVTRVKVKMSDGKTHISSSIPPDIAQIVSMMSPELFLPKSLHSQVQFVTILFRRD